MIGRLAWIEGDVHELERLPFGGAVVKATDVGEDGGEFTRIDAEPEGEFGKVFIARGGWD